MVESLQGKKKKMENKNYFERVIDFSKIINRKSIFLFGPRQVGKTTYLNKHFPHALKINLLNFQMQRQLGSHPEHLSQMIASHIKEGLPPIVVVDEIQKLPFLLDEIHNLIEKNKALRFILTGSSARKLKKSGVNLLGGRAGWIHFNSIVHPERIGLDIAWNQALQWGGLPSILLSSDPKEDLLDYVNIYIREEVKEEALVRDLNTFNTFLEVAASLVGQQIVYQSLCSDLGVSAPTVKEYFQILEDTLIAERLPPYIGGSKRKIQGVPKFYFFDNGVTNVLLGRFSLQERSAEYGVVLEQLIYIELRNFINLKYRNQLALYYWRTYAKEEIDFIIESSDHKNLWAVEVKASRNIVDKHLTALRALGAEVALVARIVVSLEAHIRTSSDGIDIMSVEIFLKRLWNEQILVHPPGNPPRNLCTDR